MSCSCRPEAAAPAGAAIDLGLLEPTLQQYADTPGSLIPILQQAQSLYGYLPDTLLAHIACRTGIPPAKVLGVVTFYTQFRTRPVGKTLILLCQGTACHVNGSAQIEAAIQDTLGVAEGDMTPDGLFTYVNVACLGCCSLSPVMMAGDKTYGGLTPDKTRKILKELKEASL